MERLRLRFARLNPVTVGGAAALAAWAALAIASRQPQPLPLWQYFSLLSVAWGATLWAWRNTSSRGGPQIWVWAILFRLTGLVAQPILEDDFHRYLWDGWVFAHFGNPYAFAPAAMFGHAQVPAAFQAILDGINHPDWRTIYGPVAEFAFLVSYWVAPGALWPWKLILAAAELLCAALLKRAGVSQRALLLLLWCPLAIQESAFTAHPDALGSTLAMAALVATSPVVCGLLLGLAGGVKLTALVLAPLAALRPWAGETAVRRFKRALITGAVMTAVLLLLCLPFGGAVVESLAGFAGQFEFNSSMFAILAAALGPRTARVLGAIMIASITMFLAWRARPGWRSLAQAGGWTWGTLFLFSPVVNPWYLLWLLPFVAIRPVLPLAVALAAVSLSYCYGLHLGDPHLGLYDHPWWVRPLEYGMIAAAAWATYRWPYWSLQIRCTRFAADKPKVERDGYPHAPTPVPVELPLTAHRVRVDAGGGLDVGRLP